MERKNWHYLQEQICPFRHRSNKPSDWIKLLLESGAQIRMILKLVNGIRVTQEKTSTVTAQQWQRTRLHRLNVQIKQKTSTRLINIYPDNCSSAKDFEIFWTVINHWTLEFINFFFDTTRELRFPKWKSDKFAKSGKCFTHKCWLEDI